VCVCECDSYNHNSFSHSGVCVSPATGIVAELVSCSDVVRVWQSGDEGTLVLKSEFAPHSRTVNAVTYNHTGVVSSLPLSLSVSSCFGLSPLAVARRARCSSRLPAWVRYSIVIHPGPVLPLVMFMCVCVCVWCCCPTQGWWWRLRETMAGPSSLSRRPGKTAAKSSASSQSPRTDQTR
jgi:hypothetical protein